MLFTIYDSMFDAKRKKEEEEEEDRDVFVMMIVAVSVHWYLLHRVMLV